MLNSSFKSVETESTKESVISALQYYLRQYKKLNDSLSWEGRRLMKGDRLVPETLKRHKKKTFRNSAHEAFDKISSLLVQYRQRH